MRYDPARWKETPQKPAVALFALCFDDLLADRAPEVRQLPVLNARGLVAEIQWARALTGPEQSEHLHAIADELFEEVQRCPVMQRLLAPDLARTLEPFRSVEPESAELFASAERILAVCRDGRYLAELKRQLREQVATDAPNDAIPALTASLVRELLDRGYSRKHLLARCDSAFFRDTVYDPLGQFDQFLAQLDGRSASWQATTRAASSFTLAADSARLFGVEMHNARPAASDDSARELRWLDEPDERHPVFLRAGELVASDPHAAAALFDEQMSLLASFAGHHVHDEEFAVVDRVAVSGGSGEAATTIRLSRNASLQRCEVENRERLAELVTRLAKVVVDEHLNRESAGTLLHALCLHQEAARSRLEVSRFLQLLAILETLTLHVGRAGAEGLIDLATPFLCRRLPNRLLARLSLELSAALGQRYRDLLMDRRLSDRAWPVRLGEALLLHPDLRDRLIDLAEPQPLLRCRIREVTEALRTPRAAAQTIDRAHRQASRQLLRVCRTRHLLARAGSTLPYLPTLIRHTHDMVDTILESIVDAAAPFPGTRRTIESIWRQRLDELTAQGRHLLQTPEWTDEAVSVALLGLEA